jgi:hypothetical protein
MLVTAFQEQVLFRTEQRFWGEGRNTLIRA